MLRIGIVVDCTECGIMADETVVAYEDATLILELTTHVDERSFAHPGVLASIRPERREHTNAFRHLMSPEFGQ